MHSHHLNTIFVSVNDIIRVACFFSAITYSKLTIETLEQGVKYINFEHISHLALVFLLLTLSR